MRLLEWDSASEVRLTQDFVGHDVPRYAVLSHTWGADTEEVTFQDLIDGAGKNKTGYNKIQFCGEQAKRDDLRYFWVDTCCINKLSSAELSEAINSMFHWYRKAVKCYVLLTDVSMNRSDEKNEDSQVAWESDFRKSRWFTRGWTLQELIAPPSVEFFSLEGDRLGDKELLQQQLHEITGIATQALQGYALSQFSDSEIMSWAAKRETKREEDMAYSLLGLFGVHMPALYGEGKENAFRRLIQEINSSRNYPLDELPNIFNFHRRLETPHSQSSTVHPYGDPDLGIYMDFLDQVEWNKDLKDEKRQAQFIAEKLRLKRWANDAGISELKESEIHDPRFRGRDLATAVKTLLHSACELFEGDENTQSRLRTKTELVRGVFHDLPRRTTDTQEAASPTSASGELAWTFKRKGQFINRLDLFKSIVDILCNLVPPISRPESRQVPLEMSLPDRLNSTCDFY
jgi:hypothetical protein